MVGEGFEQPPWLISCSWYARDVDRYATEVCEHGGTLLGCVAGFVRSLSHRSAGYCGKFRANRCRKRGSTAWQAVQCTVGWMVLAKRPWRRSQATWRASANRVAWGRTVSAQLRGDVNALVLALVDTAMGLLWPPQAAAQEKGQEPWRDMFKQAGLAGLDPGQLRGAVSEGRQG